MARIFNPFDPLAPWSGDLDLNCNDLINTGDIIHGSTCSTDFLIKNEAAGGDTLFEVVDTNAFAFQGNSGSLNVVRIKPGVAGTVETVVGDLRLQVSDSGLNQLVDIGPRWKSSDALTLSGNSTFEVVQLNPTISNVTVAAANVYIIRSASTINQTAGLTSFGSQAGAATFNNVLNSVSSSTNPQLHYGMICVATYTGGVRTLANNIALSGQASTLSSGTITNNTGVNGIALTVLGGTVTNSVGGKFTAGSFLGGTTVTASGVIITTPTAATNNWGLEVQGATGNSYFQHPLAVNNLGAPTNEFEVVGISNMTQLVVGSTNTPTADFEVYGKTILNRGNSGTGNVSIYAAATPWVYFQAGTSLMGLGVGLFPTSALDMTGNLNIRASGQLKMGGSGIGDWDVYATSNNIQDKLGFYSRVTAQSLVLDMATANVNTLFNSANAFTLNLSAGVTKTDGGRVHALVRFTGTGTMANTRHYATCESATPFDLTISNGNEDGQEKTIKNIGTAIVTLKATFEGITDFTLRPGTKYTFTWNNSKSWWEVG